MTTKSISNNVDYDFLSMKDKEISESEARRRETHGVETLHQADHNPHHQRGSYLEFQQEDETQSNQQHPSQDHQEYDKQFQQASHLHQQPETASVREEFPQPHWKSTTQLDQGHGPPLLKKDEPTTPAPPDGGWGWVVLGGCFYIAAVFVGLVLSFGILFSDLLTSMEVSSITVSWILNLHIFLWNISAMFGGSLCHHFGFRTVGFIGFAVSSVAFMCMCVATTPVHIFLLFSVLLGLTGGCTSCVCFLVVPVYFDKRRGRATAILMTGISAGHILVPLLLRYLLNEYGFLGAALIYGGILLNCCVMSLLFRPVHKNRKFRSSAINSGTRTDENSNGILLKEEGMLASKIQLKSEKEHRSKKISINIFTEVLKSTWSYLTMLRNMKLLIVTLSFSLFLVGYFNFIGQVPFAMKLMGHTPNEASWCVSASAMSNTAMRIFSSVFSDRKWFNRKSVYISGAAFASLCSFAMVAGLHQLYWIMVCLVFWGVGVGATMSVFHALSMDVVGVSHFPASVTVTSLFLALVSIAAGPLTGLLLDFTSYPWSLSASALMMLSCSLLWCLMPWAVRCDVRRSGDQSQVDKFTEKIRDKDSVSLGASLMAL